MNKKYIYCVKSREEKGQAVKSYCLGLNPGYTIYQGNSQPLCALIFLIWKMKIIIMLMTGSLSD